MFRTVDFSRLSSLSDYGFVDSAEIQELQKAKCANVPKEPGVYLVVRSENAYPLFLEESIGGHFKGRNPTVTNEKLVEKWVSSASVLYIGKAGISQKRLKQYMDYGSGKPVGHHGGRYIWQLGNSNRLRLYWKTTPDQNPTVVENQLIQAFHEQHGSLPFANLRF